MKRRVIKAISALLCVMLLLTAAPLDGFVGLRFPGLRLPSLSALKARAASGTCGENLTWDYDEGTLTLTIGGTGTMNAYSSRNYSGDDVTTAPWRSYYRSMRTLVIDSGVTGIGAYAFCGCSRLTSVTFPGSVTSVGDNAFAGCSGLTGTHITDLPAWCGISFSSRSSNPLLYSDGLYLNGSLVTDLVIPDGVAAVGRYAFAGFAGLTGVTFPESVTSIGTGAFSGCAGLTGVAIPDSVTSIGTSAFSGCVGLTGVRISDIAAWCGISFADCYSNPLYCAKKLYLDDALVTDLVIPDGVTAVGSYAFNGCAELTSVTIPDSVTEIGQYAFDGCDGLSGVRITDVAAWCGISFANSSSNPLCFAKKLYLDDALVTDLVIPDGVTAIGDHAFTGYPELTSVKIPNSVTSIGRYAFSSCFALTDVVIPDSVETISNSAFYYCSNVKTLTIGKGLTSLGSSAFQFCTALEEINYNATNYPDPSSSGRWFVGAGSSGAGITVTFGDEVERIPAFLFHESNLTDRPKITKVIIGSGVKEIGVHAFGNCAELTSVDISDLEGWCAINFGDSDSNPLSYAHSLRLNGQPVTDLVIPGGVTSVGGYAFRGCSGLTSVTVPDSVTSIGGSAFYQCTGLTRVDITDLESWCRIAFAAEYANPLCYAHDLYLNGRLVTELVIPDGITAVGQHAFSGCTCLTRVEIPEGVTAIERTAFRDCTGLTTVSLPESLTSIGTSAFQGCSALTDIEIPDGVVEIGNYAFHGCAKLGSLTLPEGVTAIGDYTFYGCSGLTDLTLLGSVTSIGSYAFCGCRGLTDFDIPDTVTFINRYAFSGCVGLTSLEVPSGVKTIGAAAFERVPNVAYTGTATGSWKQRCLNGFVNGYLVYKDEAETVLCACSNSAGENMILPASTATILEGAFSCSENVKNVYLPLNVTTIGKAAFEGSGLTDIFYEGAEADRAGIATAADNARLLDAVWHYGSMISDMPDTTAYSVVYDANGGEGAPGSQMKAPGQTLALSETVPTREGYTFTDWNTAANGSGESFAPGSDYTADESVTLYAQWEKIEITPRSVTVSDGPDKTDYTVGETLDVTGLSLTVTYSDGTALVVSEGFVCEPTLLDTAGTVPITVTYEGLTAEFFVTVRDAAPRVRFVTLEDTSVAFKSTASLQPYIKADDGARYTKSFSSSDPDVVKVDKETGEIHGLKRGAATITCAVTDEAGNTVKGACVVKVRYTFVQWLIMIFLLGFIWYK